MKEKIPVRPLILLVDDNENVLDLCKEMLEKLGYSVVTAIDGDEGIEIFREHFDQIVCVLLDLIMPRMDGKETLKTIRSFAVDTPVIITSGYSEEEAAGFFKEYKPDGFIQKPFLLMMLKSKIEEVIMK